MRTEYVLAHVPCLMRELGVTKYSIDFRELVIKANETVILKAYGQHYFLVETEFLMLTGGMMFLGAGGAVIGGGGAGGPGSLIRIESDTGVLDWMDETLNENKYEHTGKITITNGTDSPYFLEFIVVTPEVKCKKKKNGNAKC